MMNAIYKYQLPVQDQVELEMPEGAQILTVQTQEAHGGGLPHLWAIVNTETSLKERRVFRIHGTGHQFRDEVGKREIYLGTFQLHGGSLVFHVFEVVWS